MAIDRYDWHSDGDFPKELPEIAGGTHIASCKQSQIN